MGTPDDYAERYLPGIFARFARTHPLVEVEIICQSSFVLQRRINAGEIDLAIATHSDCGVEGEIIRRERLCWVSSPRYKVEERDILPLALGPSTCSWRNSGIRILDAINRPYKILYTSPSATALSAAVFTGLAITILPESAVRPGMRRLGEEDGFPDLPDCDIALLRATGSTSSSVEALANHVIEDLANLDTNAVQWM
jgi:DNA-binding transcriptional LysR family regulator